MRTIRNWLLKIMHHPLAVLKKLIIQLLIEYNKNYSKPIGSLWNYCKDESNGGAVGDINNSIKDLKSFYYKTSNTG